MSVVSFGLITTALTGSKLSADTESPKPTVLRVVSTFNNVHEDPLYFKSRPEAFCLLKITPLSPDQGVKEIYGADSGQISIVPSPTAQV